LAAGILRRDVLRALRIFIVGFPSVFCELRVEDCNSGGVKPREQIGT
jgi:hypothetical protein